MTTEEVLRQLALANLEFAKVTLKKFMEIGERIEAIEKKLLDLSDRERTYWYESRSDRSSN